MSPQEEQSVIEAIDQGDSQAFGQVFDDLSEKLYTFIYYKVHHRQTAEDLLSQTFLKAVQALSKYDPKKGRLQSWLYRIARNTVIDHYRSNRPTQQIDDAWDLGELSVAEELVDTGLRLESVRQHLAQLRSVERDVIIMRVWQEMSYAEIAQVLGKSEGNCKVIFSRSVSKLRQIIPLALLLALLLPGGPKL